jgi:hypothetical protein
MGNAIRWTPERLEQHRQKLVQQTSGRAPATGAAQNDGLPDLLKKDRARQRFQALGRLPKNRMNKTEAAYAELLEQRRRIGQILDFKFHPMNVRLASHTFYEVDFLVITSDLVLEIHEVKGGYTTEKGGMKIKLCADALPWIRILKVSRLPKKDGGGWKEEEF